VLAGSIVWALAGKQPDILIAGDGHAIAVRAGDLRLHVMRTGRDVFQLREWLAADADARIAADASLSEGVSCDDAGCVTEMGGGGLVAQSLRGDGLAEDCDRATLIVTSRQSPADCEASVIDLARRRRQGALALWRKPGGFAVEAAKPRGFDRPWSPAVEGDSDADTFISARPSPPRARDATPSEADFQTDD
jgi:competence protein ComEC